MNDAELEQLERQADREGIPLGTLIHRLVTRALGRVRSRK